VNNYGWLDAPKNIGSILKGSGVTVNIWQLATSQDPIVDKLNRYTKGLSSDSDDVQCQPGLAFKASNTVSINYVLRLTVMK